MAGRQRTGRWLRVAGIAGLAVLLSGSYCSWRGYYTPGGLQGSSTQTTIGPVGAFASVFVDGTEFSDGSASITIDGVAASESQLLVGQVATVTGAASSNATGTASTIAVTTKLAGPVSAIDLPSGTVTVLGQTVQVTGDTSVGSGVAPTDPGGLVVGTLVAVDGYRTSTGFIASRFDLAAIGQAYQVAGPIASLDTSLQTFMVGGTTVDYSTASAGLPAQLTDGSYVIVSGVTLTTATTLQATQIIAQSEVPAGASGASGQIHGAITRFGSSADFDVGGQTVATTTATTYASGTSADLAADVEVEVTGSYDANGVLTASAVTLWPVANLRVVGAVQSLDRAGQTLTVAGITFSLGGETRWDDRSATLLRTFGLSSLAIGDWVVVRGVPAATSLAASARVVERWSAPAPALVELQDVAASVAAPNFSLTGVTVIASGATFTDANGAALTAATFFGEAAGRVVRARGTLSATGALIATSVALRD
ncbi:MAG: hypothetical protein JSR54_02380 [Proteobacteria bacterium]|nr:hypothetical protein [Pseudomonadota bacterium]